MAIEGLGPAVVQQLIEVGLIKDAADNEKVLAEVALSDIWEQRKAYFNRRQYDDDWFMKKFQIPF